jgi:hypothetical protein
MKDARGHGSNGSGGGLHRVSLDEAVHPGFRFAAGAGKSMASSDAMRTVQNLRYQMRDTGAGHKATLGQAIRNLLGG